MPDTKILITGASSGIGAALARAYAAPGVTLFLWGRDRARLELVASAAREKGAATIPDIFDLADVSTMRARLAACDAQGPLDLAIFCAGLGGEVAEGQPAQDWDNALAMAEVNFTSPALGATYISGEMAQRARGHIVLVSSVAESLPLPTSPLYSGSKAGLSMFAEGLAIRMAPHGVAVTLVSPGYIDTPMSQGLNRARPFLISADRAAQIIKDKLAARPFKIVVPWQFIILRALVWLLPRPLLRFILARA
jgi:short-subunit dehydrogenase